MSLLLAICLTASPYRLAVDFEWPGSNTKALELNSDSFASTLTDGGEPIGAQSLLNWDGGVIVDAKGVYFVRGPVNVWANIRSAGWPYSDVGGKYEVCHTPSWDSSQWRDGASPNWDGTSYLFDANVVTQHTVAMMFGHARRENLYVRVTGPRGHSTFDISDVKQTAGQAYCTSTEWSASDGGYCTLVVRHNSCEQTPVPLCHATKVVAEDLSGTASCPYVSSYITLANRQYGYDVSNMAPTTVHVSAVRTYVQ